MCALLIGLGVLVGFGCVGRGHLVVDRQLPQVGHHRASGYEGEGWAIVAAPETKTVLDALRVMIQTVRVELG